MYLWKFNFNLGITRKDMQNIQSRVIVNYSNNFITRLRNQQSNDLPFKRVLLV